MNVAQQIDAAPITQGASLSHLHPSCEALWELDGSDHVRRVDDLIRLAVSARASEVYLQACSDNMDVLFRVDGEFSRHLSLPAPEGQKLIAGFYHKIGQAHGIDVAEVLVNAWGMACEDRLSTGQHVSLCCSLAQQTPQNYIFGCKILPRP